MTQQELFLWNIMNKYKEDYYYYKENFDIIQDKIKNIKMELFTILENSKNTSDSYESLNLLYLGQNKTLLLQEYEYIKEKLNHDEKMVYIVNMAKLTSQQINIWRHRSLYPSILENDLSTRFYLNYISNRSVSENIPFPGICHKCNINPRNCISKYQCNYTTNTSLCQCFINDPIHLWCMDCVSQYFDENIKNLELYSFDDISCLLKCPLCNGNVCPYNFVSYTYDPPLIKQSDTTIIDHSYILDENTQKKINYIWNMCGNLENMNERIDSIWNRCGKLENIEERIDSIIENNIRIYNQEQEENEYEMDSNSIKKNKRKRKKRSPICKKCNQKGHYGKTCGKEKKNIHESTYLGNNHNIYSNNSNSSIGKIIFDDL
jgi:hypothetical protein